MQLEGSLNWQPFSTSLSGIGAGAAQVNWLVEIPIGLGPDKTSTWQAQVLEGCGKGVPGLLGLDSMVSRDTILDLSKFSMTCNSSGNPQEKKSRITLPCLPVSGHMVLPVDWGGQQFDLSNKAMFVQDPLGLAIYFNEPAPVVETPVTETTMFETVSADVFNAPEDEYEDEDTWWTNNLKFAEQDNWEIFV